MRRSPATPVTNDSMRLRSRLAIDPSTPHAYRTATSGSGSVPGSVPISRVPRSPISRMPTSGNGLSGSAPVSHVPSTWPQQSSSPTMSSPSSLPYHTRPPPAPLSWEMPTPLRVPSSSALVSRTERERLGSDDVREDARAFSFATTNRSSLAEAFARAQMARRAHDAPTTPDATVFNASSSALPRYNNGYVHHPLLVNGQGRVLSASVPSSPGSSLSPLVSPSSPNFTGAPPAGGAPGAAPSAQCVICLTRPAIMAVDPCGHLSMCEMCSRRVWQCPMCRSPIVKTLRVYVVR